MDRNRWFGWGKGRDNKKATSVRILKGRTTNKSKSSKMNLSPIKILILSFARRNYSTRRVKDWVNLPKLRRGWLNWISLESWNRAWITLSYRNRYNRNNQNQNSLRETSFSKIYHSSTTYRMNSWMIPLFQTLMISIPMISFPTNWA